MILTGRSKSSVFTVFNVAEIKEGKNVILFDFCKTSVSSVFFGCDIMKVGKKTCWPLYLGVVLDSEIIFYGGVHIAVMLGCCKSCKMVTDA